MADVFCIDELPDYVQLSCGVELGGIIAVGLILNSVDVGDTDIEKVSNLEGELFWYLGENSTPQTNWIILNTRGSKPVGTPIENDGYGLNSIERTGDDQEIIFDAIGIVDNRDFWAGVNKRKSWKLVTVSKGSGGNFIGLYFENVSIYADVTIDQSIKSRMRISVSAKFSTDMTPGLPFTAPRSIFTGSDIGLLETFIPGKEWYILGGVPIQSWTEVRYGQNKFVAVSNTSTGTQAMTSPDGIVWTLQSTPLNQSWVGLCFSPELDLWVACSFNGSTQRIMTSPDAETWTLRTTPNFNMTAVCWSPDLMLFCAVGNSGTINRVATSPDGITWTARAASEASGWIHVAWGGGLFVATALSGTNRIMTSPDGINWTSRTDPPGDFGVQGTWIYVSYNEGLWVSVSNSSNVAAPRIITSTDAITWAIQTPVDINERLTAVEFGGGYWAAVSQDGTAIYSEDAQTWLRSTVPTNVIQWTCLIYGEDKFVAVGAGASGDPVMISHNASINIIPPSIFITSIDIDYIDLEWLSVKNANNYVLEIAEQSDYSDASEIYSGPNLTYQANGLTANTTYYVRVKAQGSGYTDSEYGTTSGETYGIFDETFDNTFE